MVQRRICEMNDLSNDEIFDLLALAKDFSNLYKDWQFCNSKHVANLFFEPSTRTHFSFKVAEHELGLHDMDLEASSSSVVKGESLYDTVKTMQSLGVEVVVIRSSQDAYYKELKDLPIALLNAGDGVGNHPSQSLLDLYTIYENFHTLKDLNVVVVGDVKHSRVATSNIAALKRLGSKVKISGPKEWLIEGEENISIDEAVEWADVVMLLRIQNERLTHAHNYQNSEYLETYGLTKERYKRLKEDAIILHPAPVNRGVEIDSDLVESEKSRIFQQMQNGVYVRKAMLCHVIGEDPRRSVQ